ncbi:PREDICTED: KH domain-containing protein akap-1 isoform X2 [Eufriesea mexicana]|uniref:KH domain-containing protein akap-1 isoform X2 n=1 Tax=Eufriesea mexicana TaxID=516756 RepID=UPI00083BBEFC|nr:PREDICTED: KH domain-containing protein akap-1 isoform X2 [Eufriesea mexicana]
MSATHIQMVKWTFPAFALIIGLLWYKRRRVDRADPGGINKLDRSEETIANNVKEVAPSNCNTSFCDSGVQIDELLSLSSSSQQVEDIICSPRKRSESLDIPRRKAGSQCISAHSRTPPEDDQEWYSYVDTTSKMEIQLDKVADSGGKMLKIFENVVEEEEQKLPSENNLEQFVNTNEENNTNNECNLPNKKLPVTSPSKDDANTSTQVLSERDSANHSPVSGVLEGSVTDEARSEGSTDSGKGGSIKGHTKDNVIPITYEFCIPQHLVGRLIGRRGSFFQSIRLKAEVHIVVKQHPIFRNQYICTIQGSSEGINVALDMIRQKFPEKEYPHVCLEQILPLKMLEGIPLVTGIMQLSLVEGMNNDIIVSHIVKPNRFFVQLPTHPTYPLLCILEENMTQLYNTTESPPAPEELSKGMILVAKWFNRWVRVYVEQPDPHREQHLVRLVDHGGYWVFSNAEMKKIRSDYLTLPFQAIEIFLANVQPTNGKWNQEAYNIVAHMCYGIVGQAQIEGYINTDTYVNLYLNIHKHGVISLAEELVARGFAESVPLESIVPEEGISIS